MAYVLKWRWTEGRRQYGLRIADELGVIMVYDSQYTRDACVAPPHVPLEQDGDSCVQTDAAGGGGQASVGAMGKS